MGPIVYNISLLINGGPIDPQRLPSYVVELGSVMSVTKVAMRAAFARALLCSYDDARENFAARVYRSSREGGFSPAESAFSVQLTAELTYLLGAADVA